jgi:hypothetical protein
MDWRDKLLATQDMLSKKPELTLVFSLADRGAPESALRRRRETFPYLPTEYLDFLSLTDGAQFDMCVMFGTGSSTFPSLNDLQRSWAPVLCPDESFAFGEDSSGSAFVFDSTGTVFLYDVRQDGTSKKVANTFMDLLSEVFMGSKYFELYPFGVAPNEWTNYLEEQGWLRSQPSS